MDFDYIKNHHFQQEHHHGSGGLMRYRSAPNSLFASLVDGTDGGGGGGGGREDFGFIGSSSSEAEVDLSRFMALCVKQEAVESIQQPNGFGGVPIGNSFDAMNSSHFDNNSMDFQLGSRNFTNLFRQNGNTTTGVEKFGTCNRKDVDYPSTQIGNQLILSGQSYGSSHMPPIANEVNKSIGGVSSSRHRLQKADGGNRLHTDDFLNSSWDNSTIRDLKRGRDNNGRTFSTSVVHEAQNAGSGNRIRGLAHHLSLPISFNTDPVEKFFRFQDPVPQQIRAKRGCATHPRSIAERMRRTRISERIKKLQDLFPDMDKQTNTADMLELAVEYIKGLQIQVKTLTDTKAKCTCSCSSQ